MVVKEEYWVGFKSTVYLIGLTYIVGHLSWMNYIIIKYLFPLDLTHAIVITLLTTALYPIWVIGCLGIIREWKLELQHDKQESNLTESGSS